jgi:hypothetical protein
MYDKGKEFVKSYRRFKTVIVRFCLNFFCIERDLHSRTEIRGRELLYVTWVQLEAGYLSAVAPPPHDLIRGVI